MVDAQGDMVDAQGNLAGAQGNLAGQSRFNELSFSAARTVILNEVKNLNSFPQTDLRTRNRALGKEFRPFGKLRAT